ncbi:MAG TPA: beta-xylosidase, partial [Verrucomicrobiae bacterium]
DDDAPGPAAEVSVAITGIPENVPAAKLAHFRIDETHSNAFTEWKRLGSPQSPTPEQYASLEKAGQLAQLEPVRSIDFSDHQAKLTVNLPRQAVSLLQFTW